MRLLDDNTSREIPIYAQFNLALEYEAQDQLSAAITYYLFAAESDASLLLQYESLLRAALCFEQQGGRLTTVHDLLCQAIAILPHRPEAIYTLARIYNSVQKYHEAYMLCSLGESIYRLKQPDLRVPVNCCFKTCKAEAARHIFYE